MAQTLEEFLVSVKYNIDAPSQQTFFESLKRVAGSLSGIAGAITGIGIAVLKLSETMAEAGEKLYWMSQRVGNSVSQIQDMTFAMSNLGMTADEAAQGIERFGAWTRNMGPSALMYMRSLGVTARDTAGQMRELGEYFRAHGGTLAAAQGTDAERMQHAIALRQAGMMGISEQMMDALASGKMEEGQRQAGLIRRLVWGGKDAEKGPQEFAKQSADVMEQFNKMGLIFTNLSQRFGLGLFNAILPELEKINDLLLRMMPGINQFMDHVIAYAPAVLHFLEGVIKGFGVLIQLGAVALETFDRLPKALQHAAEAFLLLPKAISLLGSPIFWILGGLTALLLLLDDYQHWQKDQKDPSRGHTARWDWGQTDKMFKGIGESLAPFKDIYDNVLKITTEFNNWATKLGISKDLLITMEATIGLILLRWLMMKGISTVGGLIANTAKGIFSGIFGNAAKSGLAGVLEGGLGEGAAAGAITLGGVILSIATLTVATLVVTGVFKGIEKWLQDHGIVYTDKQLEDRNKLPQGWPWWLPNLIAPKGAIQEEVPPWVKNARFHGILKNWFPPATESLGGPRQAEEMLGLPTPPLPIPPKPPAVPPPPPVNLGGPREAEELLGMPGPPERKNIIQRIFSKRGGYQTASADDNDWTVPSGFGGPIKDDDSDRLFDMLRLNFDALIEKLSDILDTLTAMALHQGVDPMRLRGGYGGNEGGEATMGKGPAMTGPEQVAMRDFYMKRLGLSAEAASGIVNNIMAESGGRPDAVSSSGARGLVQWIPKGRWAPLVAWARSQGIDPETKEGQMEMVAHDMEKNFPALLAQMKRGGTEAQMSRQFYGTFEAGGDPKLMSESEFSKHGAGSGGALSRMPPGSADDMLTHLSPGADGSGGYGGGTRPDWGKLIPEQKVHNETHINVTAPNPASAGSKIAEVMPRINEQHLRHAKGVLLA